MSTERADVSDGMIGEAAGRLLRVCAECKGLTGPDRTGKLMDIYNVERADDAHADLAYDEEICADAYLATLAAPPVAADVAEGREQVGSATCVCGGQFGSHEKGCALEFSDAVSGRILDKAKMLIEIDSLREERERMREACRVALETMDGLSDQQAMSDDSWHRGRDIVRAALGINGPANPSKGEGT